MVAQSDNPQEEFEVVIAGGGPAGLSAAQWLGRCGRRTLLSTDEKPRNAASKGLHGFLSRDCIHPMELLKLGREELLRYPSVELRRSAIVRAVNAGHGFLVTLADGHVLFCKRLLLATGVLDDLPPVKNADRFYGSGVFHCPYCDGWEVRDQPLAVFGNGTAGMNVSLLLTVWSKNVTLCSHGRLRLAPAQIKRLQRQGITIRTDPLSELRGGESLESIVFKNGDSIPCRALFFSTRKYQHSPLTRDLGCEFARDGCVQVGKYQSTKVPNLFVAGDAAGSTQLAIVAAAEGAQAAIAINMSLLEESTA